MEADSLGNGIKTFGDLKASSIPAAIGIAPCDPRLAQRVNEAQERLANMGLWWGTFRRIRICVTNACITWPRGVAAIEALNLDGRGATLRNGWYEFQDTVRKPCECGPIHLIDRGQSPQFKDAAVPSRIRIYPESALDAGAVILLQGLRSSNGEPIRNTDLTGSFDGEKLVLASPFATSTETFLAPGVLLAQKPVTKSFLRVYAVDVNDFETHVATWGPSETAPLHKRSFINNLPSPSSCIDSGDGCSPAIVCTGGIVAEAIVRMTPLPVLHDTDWLFIGNVAAMKSMIRAMTKEDQNDYAGAAVEVANAVAALRAEQNVNEPAHRTRINVIVGALPLGCVPV